MKSRKLLLAAAALGAMTLAGCAHYPHDTYAYDDSRYYYRDPGPVYRDYYGPYYYPGYYAAPTVGFGITYGRVWRHR